MLSYYDKWYDHLRILTKLKRTDKEIIIELVRKTPEAIEQGVRSRRYKTYEKFRKVVDDLTFGKDILKTGSYKEAAEKRASFNNANGCFNENYYKSRNNNNRKID